MNLLDLPTTMFNNKLHIKRGNALRSKKAFTLTGLSVSQLKSLMGNGLCAYCNSEFIDVEDATFERVNPLLGYTLQNTVMCCMKCNRSMIKTDNLIHAGRLHPECKFPMLRRSKQKGWLHNLKGKVLDLLFGRELV